MRHKYGFKIIPMVILAIVLATAAVMLLWNAVLVPVLGVVSITYWQAMGILALSRLLFGGKCKHRGHKGRHYCYGHEGSGKHQRWKEKFENLSEDEKDRMKDFFGKFKDGDKSESAE